MRIAPRLDPSSIFQRRMDLVTMGQDFLYLVGMTMASRPTEGIQFTSSRLYVVRLPAAVEAGMIRTTGLRQVSRELAQRSYAVFGQDGEGPGC